MFDFFVKVSTFLIAKKYTLARYIIKNIEGHFRLIGSIRQFSNKSSLHANSYLVKRSMIIIIIKNLFLGLQSLI